MTWNKGLTKLSKVDIVKVEETTFYPIPRDVRQKNNYKRQIKSYHTIELFSDLQRKSFCW